MEVVEVFEDIKKLKENKIIFEDSSLNLENSVITFTGKNNVLYIPKGAKVNIKDTELKFKGNDSIVYLNTNSHFYVLNIDIYNNSVCYIGKNCYFNSQLNMIISEEKNVVIGDNCLFSFDIWLRTADPHLIYDAKGFKRINMAKNVLIGDHVWVGQGATLLKGTMIGSGSIIGAGALISKKFPSNSIGGGNPIRVIKKDIFWEETCTHKYNKSLTKKSMHLKTDKYIFGKNSDNKIDDLFRSFDKFNEPFAKLDILKELDNNKNRFFISDSFNKLKRKWFKSK